MTRTRFLLVGMLLGILLLAGPVSVSAHTVDVPETFFLNGILEENGDSVEHWDYDNWKGALTITVQNSGTEGWGDFHFRLFDAGPGIDSVRFTDEGQITGSSQNGWFDISDDEHSLDFYFYDDPIFSGDTATFTVYTDNTAEQLNVFGVGFFATPVPAPGALLLLFSCLIPLFGQLRKRTG